MTHLNDITTGTNVSTRSKGSHLTIDDRVKISVLKFNRLVGSQQSLHVLDKLIFNNFFTVPSENK